MATKKFWIIVAACVLAFAGCGNGDNDDNKALSGEISIFGIPRVGRTLRAIYTGSESVSYEWTAGSGKVGENSSTYDIAESDLGKTVTVTVSASGSSLSSKPVGPVEPVSDTMLGFVRGNLFNEGDSVVVNSFTGGNWDSTGGFAPGEGRGGGSVEGLRFIRTFAGAKMINLQPGQTYTMKVYARNQQRASAGVQRPMADAPATDYDTNKNKLSIQYGSPSEDAQGYHSDRWNMYITGDEWDWYTMEFKTPADMAGENVLVIAMRSTACYIEQLIIENSSGDNIFNGGNDNVSDLIMDTVWVGSYAAEVVNNNKSTPALSVPAGASGTSSLPLESGRTYSVWVLAKSETAGAENRVSFIHGGGTLRDIPITDAEWKWYEDLFTTPASVSAAKVQLSASGSAMTVEGIIVIETYSELPPLGVMVNSNLNTTYQTIEGFGFFGPKKTWWNGSNPNTYYDAEWIDRALIDMGITMWRNEPYPFIPPSGDTGASNPQDNNWPVMQHMVKALNDRAKVLNIPLKIILSAWSPPGQWKDSSHTREGGKLKVEHYDDYGNWWVDVLDMYKAINVDVYAISLQNEPAFPEPYNSCVYTPGEYVALLKIAGPIIHASYPNVKLFGSESMLELENYYTNPGFHEAIIADPAAYAQLSAFAVHGYSDGVSPTGIARMKNLWILENAKSDKPIWMTETSGYGNNNQNWLDDRSNTGLLNLASTIQTALVYGDMSAWVYWYMLENSADSKTYNTLKQFYKFIRPGAVRVDARLSPERNDLMVSAFKDGGKMAVVFVNTGNEPYTANISSLGNFQYEYYITNESANCEQWDDVSPDKVLIPAYSVVTLSGK